MDKDYLSLWKLHEWLSIEDTANFLSETLGETFTEQRVFKLCESELLPLSIYFPSPALGLEMGVSFCPVLDEISCNAVNIVIDEDNNTFARDPVPRVEPFYGQISNMPISDRARHSVHDAFSVIYDWYDINTQTATYHETFTLSGCYHVPHYKNERFYMWIRELAIFKDKHKCDSTSHIYFPKYEGYVEVLFRDASEYRNSLIFEGIDDRCSWPEYLFQNFSQRKNDIYNPRNDNLYKMLVIQRDDLIDFVNNINEVWRESDIKTIPTPAYLDRSSEYFAEEIAIAVEAHTAVFIDKEGNQYQSLSKRVETWLQKHYPEKCTSDSFIKRIKTVVLPKKG